ncbi:kynurenine formamidase [Salsuginibacillus halophilus]|uniref:Kynurenine formamidase n=1 Tax=Salsuginibacillus halophilus TaxID=517424 RepID=A0A2P8HLJ3_9BACI|nr:cyclase family protein [Salsuginibacillus halophilus]PSL47073.1 kynurenine formamidase [Salsuginibacillus halophilus]
MTWIDISQRLTKTTPVWPEDLSFSFALTERKADNGSVNAGELHLSAHTGTHIDAPFHIDDSGGTVDELPLSLYGGRVRVIDVSERPSVGAVDIEDLDLTDVTKVLFKTNSWKDRAQFPTHVTPLRDDIAPLLSRRGIQLVGVDTPSVDPIDSHNLPAHHALFAHNIYILEGAVLEDVAPGVYELFAFPLFIEGGDGSPVRAVLRTLS